MPGPGRLTLAGREEITLGLHAGQSFTAIAARLGKAVSTVSREVAANGGRGQYRAWRAHARAREQARRPKRPKLACPQLTAQVSQWLAEWWSPVQISARLRIEFPHDPMMRVSHETIYQALYVQGRGELRRELARCLRSGRAKRRSRGLDGRSGHIKDMVMISQRPAEAAGRAVPGHGRRPDHRQGLQVSGRHPGRADHPLRAAAAPAARPGRAPGRAGHAGGDHRAARPAGPYHHLGPGHRDVLPRRLHHHCRHPGLLLRPHAPWQRGSNENTNGPLRQYLPKGTGLSVHSADDLARIAASLNNRPRKTLGFMKPSEKLTGLLAHTA